MAGRYDGDEKWCALRTIIIGLGGDHDRPLHSGLSLVGDGAAEPANLKTTLSW